MNHEPPDPEIIAAFLDGTLKGRERDQVIRSLASSPELYELVVEAAAVRAEVRPEPIFLWKRFVKSPRSVVRQVPWPAAATLVAAALAGVVFLSQALLSSPQALGLTAHASWRQPGNTVLGEGWSQVNWPATRGAAPATAPTNAALRAGVLLVNIVVAKNRNESGLVAASGGMLADALEPVSGGGRAVSLARAATTTPQKELETALERLFPDSPWYEFGLWLRQAQLSAQAGDLEFFAANAPAAKALEDLRGKLAADSATNRDGNSLSTLSQLDQLLNQINAGGFSSTTPLSESLESILNSAASIR